MKYLLFILFYLFSFCAANDLFAQEAIPIRSIDSTSKFRIISINVTGNKKTKTYIILKEIQFSAGDSIISGALYQNLLAAKQQVYNTSLFTDVQVTPEFIEGAGVKINVTVKEKWYIYPTPQFQLIDRNFNDWLKTYNASLDRVIYGAKFAHYNLSGRRDQLRIYLLNGYARNISFSYIAPASDPQLTKGFGIAAGYTQNREIPYATSYNNKLLLYKNDKAFVRNVLNTTLSYSVRKGLFKHHIYGVGYFYLNTVDSVISAAYAPNYFNTGRSAAGYTDLTYFYQYINTNNNNYPLTGKAFSTTLLKRGLSFTGGVNMLQADAAFNNYFSLKNNWYSSIELAGKIKLPFRQPYINQKALGFQDFYLRGLEYYVVDGVAAMLVRSTLKKKIASFDIPVPFHIKALPKIPITIFAKAYADAGYSYNRPQPDTRLNDRMLYTTGFGIDILTLYDLNLKIEYSFNQLGQNGLFLHAKGGF